MHFRDAHQDARHFPFLSCPLLPRCFCPAYKLSCRKWGVYQVKCTIFRERNTVIHSFAAAESVCGMGVVSELLGRVLLPFDVVRVPWWAILSLESWREGRSSLKRNTSNTDGVYTTIKLCFTSSRLFFPRGRCPAWLHLTQQMFLATSGLTLGWALRKHKVKLLSFWRKFVLDLFLNLKK